MAASVHQRLLNIARSSSRPFDEILQYFAMERFLYRLCQSRHVDAVVLKGALLFRIWDVPDSRATRDIDFLAYLDSSPETLASIVREICVIHTSDDGLVFDTGSVIARQIKEDADYAGVRVRLRAQLGNARIAMQIDFGFGDQIHPVAIQADYPVILDLPAPSLHTYPPETVIAEKAQAMVHLGALNSRMKDFYDVWRMAQQFSFDATQLSAAIRKTFSARNTELVEFDAIKAELENSSNLQRQWHAFLQKARLQAPEQFSDVLSFTGAFLTPAFLAITEGGKATGRWKPPGPWK